MLKGVSAAKLTAIRVNLFDKIDRQQLILTRAKDPSAIHFMSPDCHNACAGTIRNNTRFDRSVVWNCDDR
jgi:hypothetical protein